MFSSEYYYGLELIRPLILGLVFRDSDKKEPHKSIQIFKSWLPYLIPLILIFIWRYAISKWVNYEITLLSDLNSAPASGLNAYLGYGFNDIVDAAVTAWGQIFHFPDPILFGAQARTYYWGLVASGALGFSVYLSVLKPSPRETHWGSSAMLLGFGALLVAPIPFWVTGLDPRLSFPGDRLNLPMMLGSCLLLVGLLDVVIKFKPLKVLLIALILGFSVGYHYQNGITYRRDWQHQIEIFQQLTWRIPGLKPGTALLSNELPSEYSTDNSLIAPLNWTYAPEFSSGNLPVFLYYRDLRFNQSHRQIEPGTAFKEQYRFYPFESSADQILAIYHHLPGCLRVVDAVHHSYDPSLPDEIRAVLAYSNLGQILITQNADLPTPFQVDTASEGWCYYFEKADLARQREAWDQVVNFGNLAFEIGFPDAPSKHAAEYVVFIEGYAHTGQWARARDLTLDAYQINPRMDQMLCAAWERIDIDTPTSGKKQTTLQKVNQKLGCLRD